MDTLNKKKIQELEKQLLEVRIARNDALAKVHVFYGYMKVIEALSDERTREIVSKLLDYQRKDPWFRKHILLEDV